MVTFLYLANFPPEQFFVIQVLEIVILVARQWQRAKEVGGGGGQNVGDFLKRES